MSAAAEWLSGARVAVAGLGGLGSNIAVSLARAGVGKLYLLDFDRVEKSNLNRQYYGIRHIGMYKTDALKSVIAEINPDISVEARRVKITRENAAGLFRRERILCEALDAAESKAMLVNAVLSGCPGCKIIAGSGMAGYLSANTITTRKLNSRLYVCGDGVTDVMGELLAAPRVAVCANHMAQMALRLVLGEADA